MNPVAPLAPAVLLETYGEANIRLGRLEAEENATILYAVESGSRAWGFPSPDSDNDVRFFFVRPLSEYVKLDPARDVIERPIDGLWDINGWDLRKALKLLVGGNATVAEWLASPLIYRQYGPLAYRLRDLIKLHASPERSAAHYYGLTQACFAGSIGNRPPALKVVAMEKALEIDRNKFSGPINVNYKKYLYAIRGACAISWIERYKEIPPMSLPDLMALDIMPDDTRSAVEKLLHDKATMGECGEGLRIPALDNFIEIKIQWVKMKGLTKAPASADLYRETEHVLLSALGVMA